MFEHQRRVVGNDVDAVELRESLRGHGDEDTLVVSLEHVAVGTLALLTLKQDVHLDLAVLVARLGVVDIALAVEVGDNHNSLLVVVMVEKPSIEDQHES